MKKLLQQLLIIYIIKEFCPSKNEPQQQGISYLEREKEVVRERERGGRAGQQAGTFKVR